MCYSYALTVGIAMFELVVMGFCWLRNAKNDRGNCLGFLPLFLQEGLQAMLWQTMKNHETRWQCSPTNRYLSITVALVIHVLPLTLTARSLSRADDGPGPPLIACGHISSRWFWLIGFGSSIAMLLEYMPFCTTVGIHSHQIWPLLLIPDPFPLKPIRHALWLAYFLHIVAPLRLNPKPDLVDLAMNLVGGPTLVWLWLSLGNEFGSAWCFFASTLCLSFIPAPYFSIHEILHSLSFPFLYRLCFSQLHTKMTQRPCEHCNDIKKDQQTSSALPIVVKSWPITDGSYAAGDTRDSSSSPFLKRQPLRPGEVRIVV